MKKKISKKSRPAKGERKTPIRSFKERVYSVVSRIKKGETLSYKEVAVKAGNPKAYRAVGNILNQNRNKKVPCHRVIRSDGKTGGYNKGSKLKKEILAKEGAISV